MDRMTPPHAPLEMPEQDLFGPYARYRARSAASLRTRCARAMVILMTLALTALAANEMAKAAGAGGITVLVVLLVIVFTIAFAWIAFSAANAVTGLLFAPRPARGVPHHAFGSDKGRKTALVMPVYNEDPRLTFAALGAMARDLPPGAARDFEIFILSDTTDPEVWIAEEAAVATLRSVAGDIPVWYRRRANNHHRKAGNVGQFVRTWGARYAHMIVLDADSLLTGTCLNTLREAMLADPRAGIIQTAPSLVGARTPFALAQEFANTIVGPTVAAGVAAWQGDDGNYWGHNAIIRMEAFARSAGLPDLSGPPPFGGTILSHDFVEAALVRRSGYSVTLRTDIEGSYEGAPADLFGVIKRDRRWAQGNLQHARLLGAKGLAAANRTHFAIGILGYLMSPLWLLLVLVGVALSVQATLVRPQYFPDAFALFPSWPVFDNTRLIALFALSLGVLLVPKAIAVGRALFDRAMRRACGGGMRIVEGALVELVISTLIAPIMMLAQTSIVISIVLGRAVGWTPQARAAGEVPLHAALRFHAVHMVFGAALFLVAILHSPALAAWMSPILLALILSPLISKATGSAALGARLIAWRVMATPQALQPPLVAKRADAMQAAFAATPDNALLALASDPALFATHRGALPSASRDRGSLDPETALAIVKLAEAHTLEEYAGWLDRGERMRVLSDGDMLDRMRSLHGKPRPIGSDASPQSAPAH